LGHDDIVLNSSIRAKRGLLCAVTAFFWFAQYIYIPFLTPYLIALSMTATTVGAIVGAYGVTQLVLRIPLGITIDIVRNHKLFILIGTFLAGVSSVGMMISPSPLLLCVANGLSGVASSTWISFTVLYPVYYEKSEGTKAIGIINLFSNSGRLAAFVAGGILYEHVGIRGLFIASFASGMIGVVLALFIKREKEMDRANINMKGMARVMKKGGLLFSSIMGALAYLIIFGTVFSFSTSAAKDLGATGLELAFCVALFSGAGIVGAYFVGTKSARMVGEKGLLLLAYLLLGAYCLGIAFSYKVAQFFPLQAIAGFANGVLASSLMAGAIKHVAPDRKSTAMGFYQSVYCLGITLGPVLMGFLVDHTSSVRMSFVVMSLIALACAAAIPPAWRWSRQSR
jgi:MFS family permease